MKTWLLDTGPVVAYLNARDPDHGPVSRCLETFGGQLVTTSAVITEAMHFVSASSAGPRLLANFVAAGDIEIHDFTQPTELSAAADLMTRYHDVPMDYADATLVLLGTVLGLVEILTLDRRGFSTFRAARRKRFRLVLDETRLSR